jgi:putative SOS response-associated peptidase YedK
VCGRYSLTRPVDAVSQLGLFADLPLVERALSTQKPRWNVAPTDAMPIVRARPDAEGYQLELFRWGLIPFYAKDTSFAAKMINARSEGLAKKPAFKRAFYKRRCLVPADGFFEWEKLGKKKLPWYFQRTDGLPFAFAGLWERWHPPGDPAPPPVSTFTIITTSANALVSPLHDRMPAILDPADFDRWLDPTQEVVDMLEALLVPLPAERMSGRPVSVRVNKVENDDPDCLGPPEPIQPSLL